MRYEMDFYIHLSHDCVYGLFYLLTWMRRSSSLWHCCIPSIILESAVSWGFYWPCVVFRWLLWLGPGPKTFQRRHPSYLPGVVESTAHHCFSRRCNSHIVRDNGIGWWRILMMAHTSLVYIIRFRNPRRWQKVNIVGILFLSTWLFHASSCCQLLGAWFFAPQITCIFLNGFSIPLHWYNHANNIGRNIFCCCHYYIVSIRVCSSLSPIRNEIFHQQWYMVNSWR